MVWECWLTLCFDRTIKFVVGDVEHLGGGFVFAGEFGEGDGACGGLVVDELAVDGD